LKSNFLRLGVAQGPQRFLKFYKCIKLHDFYEYLSRNVY